MNATVTDLISQLQLQPHPEGGFFRETWRSDLTLPADLLGASYGGSRSAASLILFLLPTGTASRLHRVQSDELWLYHQGDPLTLQIRPDPDSAPQQTFLLGKDHCYQALVPAGQWQEAAPVPGPLGFTLVGCLVVPGFDFADFEMVPDPPQS
jgi:hypothetical protein